MELVADAASTALMSKVTSKFQDISLGPDDSPDQNSACECIGALPRTPRPDVLFELWVNCGGGRGVTRRWPMVYQRLEFFGSSPLSFVFGLHEQKDITEISSTGMHVRVSMGSFCAEHITKTSGC